MERLKFEQLVRDAFDRLPDSLVDLLENVDVVVQDYPAAEQVSQLDAGNILLGLYEGVPLTERGQFYGMVLPDKITLFQKSIECKCFHDEAKIAREVEAVLRHEIAHHFGIDDGRLDELGR